MQLRGTAIVVDTVASKKPVFSGSALISGSGTSVTLNDLQSNSVVLLDRTTGMTVVLPDGKPGTTFDFIVSQALASSSFIITGTPASNSYALVGSITSNLDNAISGTTFMSTTGGYLLNQRVELNASSVGILRGSRVTVTALSKNTWFVSGLVFSTGTMTTPFRA